VPGLVRVEISRPCSRRTNGRPLRWRHRKCRGTSRGNTCWLTTALLDRPTHHCHNVEIGNEDSTARIKNGEPGNTTRSSPRRVKVQCKTRVNFRCKTTQRSVTGQKVPFITMQHNGVYAKRVYPQESIAGPSLAHPELASTPCRTKKSPSTVVRTGGEFTETLKVKRFRSLAFDQSQTHGANEQVR
jgi:hypothetical protein